MKISFLILVLVTASCSIKKNNQDDWDKRNMRTIEVDDPRVKWAFKATQDSLSYFIDYFKRYHGKQNNSFYLKTSFSDEVNVEHMWSQPFKLNNEGFECTLDNAPKDLGNYKLGDTVTINFDTIEDFIIVTADTTIIGDYLKKSLSKD